MSGTRRVFASALVATLILAATEAVAGYPRPSTHAATFFAAALATYFPLLLFAVWAFSSLFKERGLDFWLPFVVGGLRMVGSAKTAMVSQDWVMHGWMLLGLVAIYLISRTIESPANAPPWLFGLTVGIVLPILGARVVSPSYASRLGGEEKAMAVGVLLGLLTFVVLRALVARRPRVAPVFLLGPVISLALWSRAGAPPPEPLAPPTSQAAARPDIVLIVLDTLAPRRLDTYGHERATMPGLHTFAKEATTFTRAWANSSWTLPGHASLFSGLRLSRHRYDSGYDISERSSPDLFLAERLRRAGYATGAVAANFGVLGREDPLMHGFEFKEVEPLRPFALKPWLFDFVLRVPWFPGIRSLVPIFPGPTTRAPAVVEHALRFWSRPEPRPRFLFVNLMEAHTPWVPDPEDLGRFGPPGLHFERGQILVLRRYLEGGRPSPEETGLLRLRYDESLYSLDRSLNRLLSAVTSGSRGTNTIVVVTADHGESLGEHDRFGHRNSLDEEVTRVPLIIRGPGLGQGDRRETPVQLTDVFGYLIAQAGVAVVGGLDALPFGERRQVILEHRPGPQGFLPPSFPRGDLTALIEWPFKLAHGPGEATALFDLEADPGESRNLIALNPGVAEAMRIRSRDLSLSPSRKTGAPDPTTEERLRALGYLR